MSRRIALVGILAVVLVFGLAACGSSAKPAAAPTPTSTPSTTTTPAGGSTTVATAPKPAAASVTVTDKDKGATVAVRVGGRVVVVLGSTYWTFNPVSDASVLQSRGDPVAKPKFAGCVPGGGCGTVTATYDAAAAGSAVVSASRTSCGEAMGCTGDQGSFRVTINVS